MRLLTFSRRNSDAPLIGMRVAGRILELAAAARIAGLPVPPQRMKDLLAAGPDALAGARRLLAAAETDAARFASAWLNASEIRYLPPVPDADKFLCVGKNYRKHLEELKRTNLIREIPQEPTSFIKLNFLTVQEI